MKKLALLVITAAALAGAPAANADNNVSVGHSGWLWGNPQPQGNSLAAIDFAGGTGYAAGAFGTLLKTESRGLTWTGIPTGTTADLTRLRVLDASTLFTGGGCVLRRSTDGGATFTRVAFTPSERSCTSPLVSFSFVNPDTGYVLLANGAVLRTDDAGQHVALKTAVPGTAAASAPATPPSAPTDIQFTSTETGFATAANQIFRTTDGGATWSPVGPAAGGALNGVYFASANVGYAVGNGKTVMKTMDGGATWGPKPVASTVPDADLTQIRCAPGSTTLCLLASKQGDQLLRTADGGGSFASVPVGGGTIYAAAFDGISAAVGVGKDGASVVSADAGGHWTPVQGGLSLPGLARMRADSATFAVAAGASGTLARTTNGGQDWSTVGVPTPVTVRDASFSSEADGFAVDTTGKLFHTTDGGAAWQPIDTASAPNPKPNAIYSPNPGTVMFIGPRGISAGEGSGNSYTFTATGNRQIAGAALTDYDVVPGTPRVIVWGPKAILSTAGQGTAIPRPGGRGASVAKVDFLTPRAGYVLNRDGRVWATRNGGARWTELTATGDGLGFDMAWSNLRNGYLSVTGFGGDQSSGYLLRTSDGGRSWRPQLVAPSPLHANGLAVHGTTGFAMAGSSLFYTPAGGDRGRQSVVTIRPNVTHVGPRGRVVTISGRLTPAVAGADVYVSFRGLNGGSWITRLASPTSPSGRFTLKRRIARPTIVVAQWRGDAARDGDGSNAVTVAR